MSKGATIPERLEAVRKQIDAEQDKWEKEKLPGPKAIWIMGDNELMHSCHLHGLTNLLQEKLGFTEDELALYISQAFLEELRKLYPQVMQMKKDAIRESIVEGINPKI